MEKMHNRGQDGAGLGCVKLNTPPGFPYMERIRNNQSSPWMNLIKEVEESYAALKLEKPEIVEDEQALTQFFPFAGELLMGHLRYGTHGDNTLNACHPFIRANNWKTKSLMVAGNFNLTNSEELLRKLVDLGQHPRQNADTVTVMERIGHFLDEENQFLLQQYLQSGLSIKEAFKRISEELDLQKILTYSAKHWDGGYVMGGFTGNGDAFVLRDPNGIRPAWFYENDEVLVMA
jgi:amidophosphoribosyltransferase